jgi:hypothetical protein
MIRHAKESEAALNGRLGAHLMGMGRVFDDDLGRYTHSNPTEFALAEAAHFLPRVNPEDLPWFSWDLKKPGDIAALEAGSIYYELVQAGYPKRNLDSLQKTLLAVFSKFKNTRNRPLLPSEALEHEIKNLANDPDSYLHWLKTFKEEIEAKGKIPDQYLPLVAGKTFAGDGEHGKILVFRAPKQGLYFFLEIHEENDGTFSLSGRDEAILNGQEFIKNGEKANYEVFCKGCHSGSTRLSTVGTSHFDLADRREAQSMHFRRSP